MDNKQYFIIKVTRIYGHHDYAEILSRLFDTYQEAKDFYDKLSIKQGVQIAETIYG